MRIEYFDVNRIVTISLRGERVDSHFEWQNPKPIKRFFGLIDTGKYTPEGYYNLSRYNNYYTEEELINHGYIVKDKVVYYKPYVQVDLEHENSLTVKFENDTEMLEWVEFVKNKSNKVFIVVDHNKKYHGKF